MTDFIEVYDNALSPELCEAIRQRFADSHTMAGETGSGLQAEWKDSHDLNITRAADWRELHAEVMNATTAHLLRYMQTYPHLLTGAIAAGQQDEQTGTRRHFTADMLTEPVAAQLMMQLYRPGEIMAQSYPAGRGGYHHWHSEIYPRDASCETLHRVLLFMYYINDVAEGGETEFCYQDIKISPQAGRMVIAPAGFTHTHKGHVPISGDKLILTSRILFNRAETIYGSAPAAV